MDIASYSSDSRAVIKNAREVAAAFRHPEIYVEHLLMATIRHEGSEVESILNQLGKSHAFVESTIEGYLKDQGGKSSAKDSLTISPGVYSDLGSKLASFFQPFEISSQNFLYKYHLEDRMSSPRLINMK